MLAATGFGHAGIRAGSLAAACQSAAMGGAVAAPLVVVAASVAGAAVAVAAVASEYSQAQRNDLGEGADVGVLAEARQKTPWVLVWENWWHGRFFQVFSSHKDALIRSKSGGKLRRMIVKLDENGFGIANEHGQQNPWTENDFHGENAWVDNGLRNALRRWLEEMTPIGERV